MGFSESTLAFGGAVSRGPLGSCIIARRWWWPYGPCPHASSHSRVQVSSPDTLETLCVFLDTVGGDLDSPDWEGYQKLDAVFAQLLALTQDFRGAHVVARRDLRMLFSVPVLA